MKTITLKLTMEEATELLACDWIYDPKMDELYKRLLKAKGKVLKRK